MGLISEGTFYLRPEDTMYEITAELLNHFLKLEIIMQHLMENGIHNWEGYDDAMAKAYEEMKGGN